MSAQEHVAPDSVTTSDGRSSDSPGAAAPRGSAAGPSVIGGAVLGADVADDLLIGTAREAHEAISKRVFDVIEMSGLGVTRIGRASRVVHDAVSRAVYAGLGAAARGASKGLRELDKQGAAPRLESYAQGRFLIGAVNGLIGDKLVDEGSDMAVRMSVRVGGADVAATADGLREAFPDATDRLVVFVHGLCESEEFWWRDAAEQGGSYGDRLAASSGWSPVYLRVNTGLPIAENGVALAGLLDEIVAAWPVPVERLAFVGHSMGGLVVRSACVVTTPAADPWTRLVTDVVTLGTPHLGAPLEQVVAVASKVMGRVPEAAPFGRIFEYRSRGVLDLRSGLARDVENLPHARYRLVGATLAASTRHPVSGTAGDMLVRWPSAIGRPRSGPEMFPGADTLHVPSADHFDLLNHPDVFAAIVDWLA